MHHRIRGARCRHIEAVHIALGQIGERTDSEPVPNGEVFENYTSMDIDRLRSDLQEEENRRDLVEILEDDEYFYTENDAEFRSLLGRAAQIQPEYEYENVLNGSKNTFGIELEFVGGDSNAIARELYQLGICAYDHRVGYHDTSSPSVPGKWKMEFDCSVADRYSSAGGELVSPVLEDTPETWKTIEKICEVAKRHGARIDERCGSHVHVGMDPLDTARQRWKRFFKTIAGFEDVIYRVAGGTLGQIRNQYTRYASPFAERSAQGARTRIQINDISDVHNLARQVSRVYPGRDRHSDRYHGVNLTNIYDSQRPNTIEFRYFNGSLDACQIQSNVKLANGVLVAATKARTKENSTTSSMQKRGNILKAHSLEGNNRTDSALKKFVDIIFTRKKDKDRIIGVYAKNTWAN